MHDQPSRSVKPTKGRPARINLSMIGRAVVDLGFATATFSAIAEKLEISEMTVYRNAPDRRRLMAAGLEFLIAHHTWPSFEGSWKDTLRSYALETWDSWASHPGAAEEIGAGAFPAAWMRVWADVTEVLLSSGFTNENAMIAGDLVFDFAAADRRGTEKLELLANDEMQELSETIDAGWELALEGRSPESRNRLERSREESALAVEMPAREWFIRRLDVLLRGIEADLAPESKK